MGPVLLVPRELGCIGLSVVEKSVRCGCLEIWDRNLRKLHRSSKSSSVPGRDQTEATERISAEHEDGPPNATAWGSPALGPYRLKLDEADANIHWSYPNMIWYVGMIQFTSNGKHI